MIFTFMNSRKFNTKLGNVTRDPVSVAMLILLVVLAYLVIWPFFQLVINTLTWSEALAEFHVRPFRVNLLGFIGFK